MSAKRLPSVVWQRLQMESRRTVIGFALKIVLVLPVIVLAREPLASIRTIALLYALWCSAFAIICRQRAYGPVLNYWDEALWFSAMGCAARVLASPSG